MFYGNEINCMTCIHKVFKKEIGYHLGGLGRCVSHRICGIYDLVMETLHFISFLNSCIQVLWLFFFFFARCSFLIL